MLLAGKSLWNWVKNCRVGFRVRSLMDGRVYKTTWFDDSATIVCRIVPNRVPSQKLLAEKKIWNDAVNTVRGVGSCIYIAYSTNNLRGPRLDVAKQATP